MWTQLCTIHEQAFTYQARRETDLKLKDLPARAFDDYHARAHSDLSREDDGAGEHVNVDQVDGSRIMVETLEALEGGLLRSSDGASGVVSKPSGFPVSGNPGIGNTGSRESQKKGGKKIYVSDTNTFGRSGQILAPLGMSNYMNSDKLANIMSLRLFKSDFGARILVKLLSNHRILNSIQVSITYCHSCSDRETISCALSKI